MNQYEIETRDFEEQVTAVVFGGVARDDLPAFLDRALPEAAAYQELERWLEAHGHTPDGGPWEVYVTDSREEPDPSTWRTLVVQPFS